MGARASSNSKDTEPRNATRAEHLKGSEGRDSQRRRDARETTRNARVKSQLKVEGLPSHQGAEAAGQSWKSLILNSLLVNTIFWGGARRPNGTTIRGQREGTLTLKYRFRVHSLWSTTLSGRDCHAVASPRPVPRLPVSRVPVSRLAPCRGVSSCPVSWRVSCPVVSCPISAQYRPILKKK